MKTRLLIFSTLTEVCADIGVDPTLRVGRTIQLR